MGDFGRLVSAARGRRALQPKAVNRGGESATRPRPQSAVRRRLDCDETMGVNSATSFVRPHWVQMRTPGGNLLARDCGTTSESIAIDCAYTGIGPAGDEVAPLVVSSVMHFKGVVAGDL